MDIQSFIAIQSETVLLTLLWSQILTSPWSCWFMDSRRSHLITPSCTQPLLRIITLLCLICSVLVCLKSLKRSRTHSIFRSESFFKKFYVPNPPLGLIPVFRLTWLRNSSQSSKERGKTFFFTLLPLLQLTLWYNYSCIQNSIARWICCCWGACPACSCHLSRYWGISRWVGLT